MLWRLVIDWFLVRGFELQVRVWFRSIRALQPQTPGAEKEMELTVVRAEHLLPTLVGRLVDAIKKIGQDARVTGDKPVLA